jgi:hypothetical protein
MITDIKSSNVNPQYVVDRTRSLKKHNAHFQLCTKIKQPFITVWPKTKFAEVAIDLDSISLHLSETKQEQIRQLFYDLGGQSIHVTSGLCSAKRIPVSEAENLAMKLFQIATTP